VALVAALALAIAAGACGDDDGGGGSSGEAKALLERGFKTPVKTGELELDVKADFDGGGDRLDDPIALKVEGPFEWGGAKKLPRFDWDVAFEGADLKLKGGLIATSDNAYVELQGKAYEVGREAFGAIVRQYSVAQPGRPQGLGAFGIDPSAWLEDPEVEDGDSIGGDATRKVSGSVDVRKAVLDIVQLANSPRLRRQLERQRAPTPSLPKPSDEDLDELEDAIEEFDIEVNVDENDVVRRVFTEIDFDVPGDESGDDLKGGRISLNYVVTKVGGKPVIRTPLTPQPLQQLLDGFGLGGLPRR
jgi:hypothetical protein